MDIQQCSVAECDQDVRARGLCNSHYRRLLATGSVEGHGWAERGKPFRWLQAAVAKRERDEGCWLDRPWKSRIGEYPTATPPGGPQQKASHIVLALDGRPRPFEGAVARHSCDTPECLNPAHLCWGTQAENIADMVRRNRARSGGTRGESHGNAKLTEGVVRDIRRRAAAGEQQKALAREYGVGQMAVSLVVRRKAWAHVD